MTSAVGIVGSSSGAVSNPSPPLVPLSSGDTAVSSATPIQNPRIIQDPTAGFITQYMSVNGNTLVTQVPSVVTVAYLRLGLSADGTPLHKDGVKSVAATA